MHIQISAAACRTIGLSLLLCISACQGKDPIASGRAFFEKGEYRSAQIEFKNALQSQPKSLDARLLLADTLERMHDLPGAEQQLRNALDNGGDPNLLVPRIALLMLDMNATDKLTHDFRDTRLSNAEANSRLRAAVSIAYGGIRRPLLAAQQLEGTIDLPEVKLARAQLAVAEGKLPQALAMVNASKADASTPWWILRATARMVSASGDQPAALRLLAMAHASVPWHQGVTGEYGEAMIRAGQPQEAMAVRDQLRKQAPNSFWTHYLDALLLARAGRNEESHASALRVLRVSPDFPPAILLAASAELQSGDVQMANKRLQGLLRQNPGALPVLRLLAQSELRTGKTSEAADTVRRGLLQAPQDPSLLLVKADLDLARGDRKTATATFESVLALYPDDVGSLLRLAELKAAGGDLKGATQLIDRAGAASQNNPAVHGRAVAAALRMGNLPQARALAEAGIAAQPNQPQVALQLAAVQSAQKDMAGAWATTLAVLDKKPDTPPALMALSSMARTPEQRGELLTRYNKAMDAKSTSAQVYLDYATLLRASPDAKTKPLDVLTKGVAAAPLSVAVREALVDETLRSGDPEKALSIAQSGAAISNGPSGMGGLLAATYERLGKSNQALESYRKLAANFPQRTDWRLKLANLEANAGRQSDAVSLLRALLVDRPFDAAPYLALAATVSKDNPKEAMSVAQQMGQRSELKGASLLLIGDLLVANGKTDDALVQYSAAGKAGMEPAATLRAVQALDKADRAANAEQELTRIARKFPNDATVVSAQSQRALVKGNPAQAVELLQKLAQRTPADPVLMNDLAWAQIQAGDANALRSARSAATALPNNANVLDTLGVALAKAGQRDEAIATLRTAANLAPLAALPRLHLSEQLLAAGDKRNAAAMLQPVKATQFDEKNQVAYAKIKAALAGS